MPVWDLASPRGPDVTSEGAGLVTLGRKSTFAITELLGTSDSLAWKRQMLKLGLLDVTPVYGSRRDVVTFDKRSSEEWENYRREFAASPEALGADWQYLSGHHSAHVQPGLLYEDAPSAFDEHEDCVFFNEAYHHGAWEGEPPRPNSVAMCVSRPSVPFRLEGTANPFVWPFVSQAKGVIANGCNTFSYRYTRMWLRKTFPLAIIFGFLDKTPAGPEAIYPLIGGGGRRGLYQDRAEFWTNPVQYFSTPSGTLDVAKLEADLLALNVIYFRVAAKDSLAVLAGDRLYFLKKNDDTGMTALARVENGTILNVRYSARWS